MKNVRSRILLALALYVIALGVTWVVGSRQAHNKTRTLLERSESIFIDSINDCVACAELQVAIILRDRMRSAAPQTVEAMQKLKRELFIDEINIVATDGRIIGTSEPSLVGHTFYDFPETVEFMALTNRPTFWISQPFRAGRQVTQDYRKYTCLAFKDASGLIQIGYDFDRLMPLVGQMSQKVLTAWKIGDTGNFDLYDGNCDGIGDYVDKAVDGELYYYSRKGKNLYVRPFTFAGQRFVSVLPPKEYYEQRDIMFLIMAPILAAAVLMLAWFLRSQVRLADADLRRRAVEDRARARDLKLARAIQMSSLAHIRDARLEELSLTFTSVYHPAREVGGDFYDHYRIDSAHWAYVIADVSGKGIPAAMYMMRSKSVIFNALSRSGSLVEAVERANETLCVHNEAEMFVTAWIAVVDILRGEVEYVSAGHEPPIRVKANGAVDRLEGRGGFFLGMFPGAKYVSRKTRLEPGDLVFGFTDGITEAMNAAKQLYGKNRLMTAMLQPYLWNGLDGADRVIDAVVTDVRKFAGDAEQSDDITVSAFVWHGRPQWHSRSFAVSGESLAKAMEYLQQEIVLDDRKAKARLLNAADEMMTNIVSYSGANDFTIVVSNAPGRTRVVFSDDGHPYNPLSHDDPDTHVPLAERPIGGLGILMTKKLVDFVDYHRDPHLNHLTIVKLDGPAPHAASSPGIMV